MICLWCKIWKKSNSSVFIYFLLFVLTSCWNQDSNSIRMRRAEREMTTDARVAMDIIDSIPDSVLNHSIAPNGHNMQCLTVARYNKAANNIQENNWNGAKLWLQLVIIQNEEKQERIRALKFYDALVTLCAISENKADAKDSLKETLLSQILATNSTIKHFTDENTFVAKKRILNNPLYWSLIIILIISISVLLFYQHKKNKEKTILDYQKEINQLNKDAIRMKEDTSERLGIGKQFYDTIRNGGLMKNISIEHEQCFIDYYAFMFPHEYDRITSPYVSLSLRHTTFLILKQMGYSNTEIQNILFIKASTIRNYRLRIEKNRKN